MTGYHLYLKDLQYKFYVLILIKHNSSLSYLKNILFLHMGKFFYYCSYLITLVPIHHADLHIVHTITNLSFNMQPYPYLCCIVAIHA